MIRQRYTCSFYLHKRDSNSASRLMCRIRWNSSRSIVEMNVGFVINPERWDKGAQRCTKGSFHGKNMVPASVINREIQRWEDAAGECFKDDDVWPTSDQVSRRMKVALGMESAEIVSVEAAIDRFVTESASLNGWTKATIAKFKTMKAQLFEWKEALRFDDFDQKGLTDYTRWLQDHGSVNSTVRKKIGYVKWFLRWAFEQGYHTEMDFMKFRPQLRIAQNRVVYLTWDELMRVWNWQPASNQNWLGKVRDIFCFCAMTSVRYSDAMALRWSDVFEDSFFVLTQKTDDPLEIDLNKWSRQILDKYREHGGVYNKVFPQITNQVMNRGLKEVMRICGIDTPVKKTIFDKDGRRDEVKPKWQMIGTHTARRTFICNALIMGIAPNVVMKWTGHSDYKSMKPYVDIADRERRKAMSVFDMK